MKIIDAIKEKGNPFEIPDCVRWDLPEFFVQMGFKVGVEIGVSFGENLEKFCQAGLTMYGVDPWISYPDDVYRPLSHIPRKWKHETIDDIHDLAVERLSKYPNCKLIRKMSLDALDDFPRRSLDFIYIDGNHKFGYIAMDLMKWADKVKRGGIIAGHDYYSLRRGRGVRMVQYVVEAFVQGYDINNWYTLGRKNPLPGERTDECLSFMFFKHW